MRIARILLAVTSIAAALAGAVMMSERAEACACCGTYHVIRVAPDDTLNIRSGPGTSYRIVGEIPHDASCFGVSGPCVRGWCKVRFERVEGWINMHFVGRQP